MTHWLLTKNGHSKKGHDLNVRCAMIASKEYCKSYAIKQGVKIDEKSEET